MDIQTEILKLKKNLQATDYMAIKLFEGELTNEEYEPIKKQRRKWREDIRALEIKLPKIVVDNAN